ncbi:MAG: hypothetical protein JNM93_00665 [Bacteriovoracaceae bacterium]|nr:hypothetical protein [Bacteriovoracaceae bacterium]
MINTIEFSRRLEGSGFKREQAEGIMTVNLELIELHLPSKVEVELLNARIDALETKIALRFERMEEKFDLKLEKLETKMDKRFEQIDNCFNNLNKVLMWAFGLLFSTQLAIIFKIFF